MNVTKTRESDSPQTFRTPAAHGARRLRHRLPSNTDFATANVNTFAGNFATQYRLRTGIQTNLAIGSSGDQYEQEANRVAEKVLTGKPADSIQRKCSGCTEGTSCQQCGEAKAIQAKEHAGDVPPFSYQGGGRPAPMRGGGQPLSISSRKLFESRFGSDFSGVRVHTDADAAESANAIHARAYTAGQDIAFGAGEYSPDTSRGQELLAHELTHVVQQTSGGGAAGRIQRQPDFETSEASDVGGPTCDPAVEGGVCEPEPEPPVLPKPAPPEELKLDADPCELEVTTLTNEALIAQINRTRKYLDERSRGDDDYYAFANLMRRLAVERQERMKRGHVWIGDDTQAPASLYQLTSGSFGEVIIELTNAEAERKDVSSIYVNSQLSIVTPWQLRRFLDSQHISDINADEYFAQYAGRATPFPMRVLPPLTPLASELSQFKSFPSRINLRTTLFHQLPAQE